MSLWTVLKLFAAVCVLAVMAFTGMLAYHILVRPLGGVFEKIIPNPTEVVGRPPEGDFAKMLDSAELPDIDPGEKAFQKAHELLALGKLDEAREKLTTIINVFPSSSSAPTARRIVGEMNLDEILSTTHMEGKQVHVVKRGNSFLGIAGEHDTSLDIIMHLNNMMELKNIQPGEELVVMPLNFRILIEPQRKTLSFWDGDRFIREYPIIHLGVPGVLPAGKTKISSKIAEVQGKRVAPQSKDYRSSEKLVQIAKPSLLIRGAPEKSEEFPHGIIVRPQDMEEISLLTRVGNEVEIR
ncbi:MAG: LysM domain-containing protein [Luteolibacter sp.]|uniref:LysM peptidoglycan-binding domain-containing protein n=1 Tax=Luteolibacter sp. TaxID=1962973 RepID=UPI003266967C